MVIQLRSGFIWARKAGSEFIKLALIYHDFSWEFGVFRSTYRTRLISDYETYSCAQLLNPLKRSQTAQSRARSNLVFALHAATSSSPAPLPQSATTLVSSPLLPSPNPVYGMRSMTALLDPPALWQSSYTFCTVHRARHAPATARPAYIGAHPVTVDAHIRCKTGYALGPRLVTSFL